MAGIDEPSLDTLPVTTERLMLTGTATDKQRINF